VGRVAAEKNLELAIESYRALKLFSDGVKFVIVGDGPLRRALQREHTDLIFAGMHTGEQLARHYASAAVFLFPSETETFGNVTLEAMASGLVVIAYNYAGAKVLITHGETGLLVRYRSCQPSLSSGSFDIGGSVSARGLPHLGARLPKFDDLVDKADHRSVHRHYCLLQQCR
jgi:glycosyltransferase involved in cell wall biosynthesis